MKYKNGFTLVELLVTISVISVLTGMMLRVINIEDLNRKSRDSQRMSDAKKIQTALELYYVDKRAYVKSSTTGAAEIAIDGSASDLLTPALVNGQYIDKMPTDPKKASGLNYLYSSDGTTYKLRIPLEFSGSSNLNQCTGNNPYSTLGSYKCEEFKNPI